MNICSTRAGETMVAALVLLPASAEITKSIFIDLGISLMAGFVTNLALRRLTGWQWYCTTFIPKISPLILIALLFTIIVMLSLNDKLILAILQDVRYITPRC